MLENFSKSCPKCKSNSIAEIVYGMPDFDDEELKRDLLKKKIVLGGCVVWGGDPKLQCNDCEYQWS
jgi:hypothetical protein